MYTIHIQLNCIVVTKKATDKTVVADACLRLVCKFVILLSEILLMISLRLLERRACWGPCKLWDQYQTGKVMNGSRGVTVMVTLQWPHQPVRERRRKEKGKNYSTQLENSKKMESYKRYLRKKKYHQRRERKAVTWVSSLLVYCCITVILY